MLQKSLLVTALTTVLCGQPAWGQGVGHVPGYVRSNGTYVAPHYRTNPDGNFNNNWGTKPNINPYTGQTGTRVTPPYSPSLPFPSYGVSGYSAPRVPSLPSLPSLSPGYGWPSS